MTHDNIQVKECYALLYYVEHFAPSNVHLMVQTDSQAVEGAFNNKYSKNEKVNEMLGKLLKILEAKMTTMELKWISTKKMAEHGADPLTRNFESAFEDPKSLSEIGLKKLKKMVNLGPETVDLFASSVDNPLQGRYAHISWDLGDKQALGCDCFEYLDTVRLQELRQTLYAYWGRVLSSDKMVLRINTYASAFA